MKKRKKVLKNRKTIPAIIWKEGNLFVAKALSLELASQGTTQEEALFNLQEALDLFLEDEGVSLPLKSIPQNPRLEEIYA